MSFLEKRASHLLSHRNYSQNDWDTGTHPKEHGISKSWKTEGAKGADTRHGRKPTKPSGASTLRLRFSPLPAADKTRFCAPISPRLVNARNARSLSAAHPCGKHTFRGTIPAHDGAGPLHVAFAVTSQELPQREAHLHSNGVEILSRVSWPRGGQSIYFRDLDGNLLELLTPGVWATY